MTPESWEVKSKWVTYIPRVGRKVFFFEKMEKEIMKLRRCLAK